MKYLIALISILLGSAAQYFLKVGMSQLPVSASLFEKLSFVCKSLPVWTGLFCYGLSMVFWLYVLSRMELSKAYPLVSLGYVFTLFIGWWLLDESLSAWKICGVAFIIAGVVCIARA